MFLEKVIKLLLLHLSPSAILNLKQTWASWVNRDVVFVFEHFVLRQVTNRFVLKYPHMSKSEVIYAEFVVAYTDDQTLEHPEKTKWFTQPLMTTESSNQTERNPKDDLWPTSTVSVIVIWNRNTICERFACAKSFSSNNTFYTGLRIILRGIRKMWTFWSARSIEMGYYFKLKGIFS